MERQQSFFDNNLFNIDKPIRLITLFSGYDSQALALKYLGVPFEHYRTCEWAVKSIQALHDLHFDTDTIDYAKDLTQAQLVEYLSNKGISIDYKKPMTKEQISRKPLEWLKTVYNNIKSTHNMVNIQQVHGEDLGIVDTDKYCYLMTYSFPCFTSDSLVLTSEGYKHINDIKIGDDVITHDNTYHKVVNVFDNGVKPIVRIKAMGTDEIKCTTNHKFYVRTRSRVGHYAKRVFSTPHWESADRLTKNDFLGIAINQNSIIPKWDGVDFTWADGRKTRHKNQLSEYMDNADFWWVVGRYIGDGWIRKQGGIVICCEHKEQTDITNKLDKLFNYCVIPERTVDKIHIPLKELSSFMSQFGKGAINKHLTNTIFDLPQQLLHAFLDGYISADGTFRNGYYSITTISRELAYGIGQCVAKVYRRPYSITKSIRPPKHIIENRVVNQHNTYLLRWKPTKGKQDNAFFENGNIWCPISSIEFIEPQNVYDIEVETNHSFTVQNFIVHNCQSCSNAGKSEGFAEGSGTTSSMLWEIKRIFNELTVQGGQRLPQVLVMENVPQVHGTKFVGDFEKWIDYLRSLGYVSYWKDLNAKDYKIPQNRDRCFMVSILGKDNYYEFPKRLPLKLRLKNVLETNVSNSYYLSDNMIDFFVKHNQECIDKGNGFRFIPSNGDGAARTISTRSGGRMDDNFIYEDFNENNNL